MHSLPRLGGTGGIVDITLHCTAGWGREGGGGTNAASEVGKNDM